MSKPDKSCINCSKLPTVKNSILDIYLCKDCENLPKYKLMCKTDVKNTYFLTDKDLELVRKYITFHKRNRCNMTLYHLQDIEYIFSIKYNTDAIDDKCKELQAVKLAKKNKRKDKQISETQKRRLALIKALQKSGLELRSDSSLCNGYIDGTNRTYTVPQIVNRMCQMKYLFDYCDMDTHLYEARKRQREEYEQGYFPDCSVFEDAEYKALPKDGYPLVWPWL